MFGFVFPFFRWFPFPRLLLQISCLLFISFFSLVLFDFNWFLFSRKQYFYSNSNWIKYCLWSSLPTRSPVSFLAHSFSDGSTQCHTPRASILHIGPRSLPLLPTPYRFLPFPTPLILNLLPLPPPPSLPSPILACLPLFLPVLPSGFPPLSLFFSPPLSPLIPPSSSSFSLSCCSSDPTSLTVAPPVPNLDHLLSYPLLQNQK